MLVVQQAFLEMIRAGHPRANEYITHLISDLPDDFSIMDGNGKLCFSIYGKYVFKDPNPLLVIQVALSWLDHEKNNATEAEWDPDRILLHICDTIDELHQHKDIVGRDVTILPYSERNLPLLQYPAVTKTPAKGSNVIQYDTTLAAATSAPNFAAGSVAALRHKMLDDHVSGTRLDTK